MINQERLEILYSAVSPPHPLGQQVTKYHCLYLYINNFQWLVFQYYQNNQGSFAGFGL